MPESEDLKNFEVRIARLEKLVEQSVGRREASNLSAEEVQAYQKVRDIVAADFGEFCGINDCFRCIVRCLRCFSCFHCIVPCINECNCGPCIMSGETGLRGGLGRFSNLGG